MVRTLVLAAALLVIWAGTASAQIFEFTGPIGPGSRVLYDVARVEDASATPILYLDGRPYSVASYSCTALNCTAIPSQGFLTAASTAVVHVLDVALRNAAGESPRASAVLVTPEPPAPVPAIGPCPYVSPQGVASPKAPGDATVNGYNPLNLSSAADRTAHELRMEQLRQWGFTVRDWPDPARNRVLILSICRGVPQ